MATKLLDETRIRSLHQAALDAGLASQRADLLRGLDASFVASLPVSSSLSAQLFTDLHELCVALRDGSVPVVTWLKNAVSLAGGRAAVVVFEEALAHLGHPVPARSATVREAVPRAAPTDRLDVVILVALHDELEAVLALGEGGRAGWEEKRDLQKFRYFRRRFSREDGRDLVIAAAWIGEMGERAATSRGQQLVQELNPACLAMCGICAGWRKKLALGDVVVADRLYSYDHGKIVVAQGGEEELFHDIETFSLEKTWKMDAAFLARAISLGALAEERPPSREAQRLWLLDALHAHEKEGAPAPEARAEWKRACPDHAAILTALDADKLVDLDAEALALTEDGHRAVRRERRLHPAGRKVDRELRIEVGAMATGKTVREDPELFERLARLVRSTIAVDMEGMAIAEVAGRLGRRSIVVKAVSDHADHEKDDRFRAFACKASATFLLAFLRKHLDPDPPSERRDSRRMVASEREPEGVAFLRERRGAGFIDRVEQVCRLRLPSALLQSQAMPYPFDGALMVIVPKTPVTHRELHVALEQPITEDVLGILVEILLALRRDAPLPCKLVHLAPTAPAELALRAQKLDVELITFSAYQGLVDFSRYTAWLSRRLEKDTEYPSWLYVEQPASISLSGQMPEAVPSAIARMRDLLTTQERRFALILGDFGAGKSFLLRELARSLLAGDGSLIPVLVEMRYLEKQLSLRGLLAQHFGAANAGSVDIDAFLYMLHQGRVVLLFDGFDELAVRVTFDQVLQHFAVITGAVEGKAKVIVSSRRQHFLDDARVRLELAQRAEQLQGYRLVELQPFEEAQIRKFLSNRLQDEGEAEKRYRLIHDVKDLLGLSHNPRMLSFIADLERERLEGARDAAGEITPAKLYEVLLDRWLEGECKRTQVTKESLWAAVRAFARKLWATPGNAVDLASMPSALVPRLDGLRQALTEEEARLVLGSRSLLKRDAEGMFSFVHRSVLEWLVASEAVAEIWKTGEAPVLDDNAISPLMARFFVNLAGQEAATEWVRRVFAAEKLDTLQKNALQVAGELQRSLAVDLENQDLRGVNLAKFDLRGANLRGAHLEGVILRDRDLTGADLTRALLARADLSGAVLTGADLTNADLSFARLVGADLSKAKITGARLLGAKLIGVKGLSGERLAFAERWGAAVLSAAATAEIPLTPAGCNAVAYHPSGHLLATGHDDGTVRLWDAATGKELRALLGHADRVRSIAFSPNGGSLASSSDDSAVWLWNTTTGYKLRELSGSAGGLDSVTFSSDGKSIAVGSWDKKVRRWNVAQGHMLPALRGHTENVSSVTFSPDSQLVASGSKDKTVRLWDARTGYEVRTFNGHNENVSSVAFSPDGRSLVSGSWDKTVRQWDAATGRERRVISGHTENVSSVAFSPDGRSLASGSSDKTVRLWDAATGYELHMMSGHTESVSSLAFSPDGRSLASGSEDKVVRLWDTATGHELRALSGHTKGMSSLAVSPDGRMLASSLDKTVRLWDVATGYEVRVLAGHTESVSSVAFSPDGRTLASSSDKSLRLWDPTTGHEIRAISGTTRGVLSVAFSPDGRTLASGSKDKKIRLWDAATGHEMRALSGHTLGILSVAFSPDGRSIASGSADAQTRLWDAATGAELHVLSRHTARVGSVAFSPDGRSLASGSKDKTVRLWDVATGSEVRVLAGHMDSAGSVASVAFSPDGQWLASGSADKRVLLWDAMTGKILRPFLGHTDGVLSVAFSPDGRSIASSSDDGTLRLWDIASGRCFAVLLSTPEGWVSFIPEAHPGGPPRGAFKMGGTLAGSFWHVIGLARFEPGELDEFLPEGQKLRLPDDHLFLPPAPPR